MAIIVKDRVKETSTTTGTGTVTLAGAEAGFQAFSVIGNSNQTYYAITDGNGTGWEVGIGTYTSSGTTLSRDTILESSNSGSAITLSANTHTVFSTYPAERSTFSDQGLAKTFTASGAITAGKPTILEADGDATQIKVISTGATVTEAVGTAEEVDANGYYGTRQSTICNIGSDKVLAVWRSYTDHYLHGRVGTVDGTNKTTAWGTETVVYSANANRGAAIGYDPDEDAVCMFYYQGSIGDWAVNKLTISGTTISTATAASLSYSDYQNSAAPAKMCYDPDNNQMVVIAQGDGTQKPIAMAFDITGTNATASHSSKNSETLDAVDYEAGFDYDTVNNKFIGCFTGTYSAGVGRIKCYSVTNSGSAFTWGAELSVGVSGSTAPICVSYNTDSGNFLCTYTNFEEGVGDNSAGSVVLSLSGTDVTAGTPVQICSVDTSLFLSSMWNDTAKKHIIVCEGSTTSINIYYGTISGTTPTFSGSTSASDITLSSTSAQHRAAILRNEIATEAEASVVFLAMDSADAGGSDEPFDAFVYNAPQTPVLTPNLTATNYLGVAATTASDTEEVKINLPDGSINNSQSGLTIGDDYFSTTAGVVGKSGTQFLGKAVSATALELEKASDTSIFGTADGAITAGNPVIVEADGDFAEVATLSGFGDVLEIDSASAYFTDSDSDNNGTILVVYRGASNYGYATVVTIDGTTLSAGTPTVFESSTAQYPRVSYDTSQSKFLVCWQDSSNTSLQGIVATVTGTSVSFGTKDEGDSDCLYQPIDTVYDSDAEKHWVAYNTTTTNTGLEVIIATVSGTSISWGTAQAISSGDSSTYPISPKIVYNSDDSMAVIGYYEADWGSSTHKIYYHGATVSGTVMTFGTKISQDGYVASSDNVNICYDSSSGKFVTLGAIAFGGSAIYSNILSNSGTTLTLGSRSDLLFTGTFKGLISTGSGKVMSVTGFNSDPSGDVTAWGGTVGASSVTWDSPITVATDDSEWNTMANNPNDSSMLFAYQGSGGELLTRGYLLSGTSLTDSNFLGFALSTVADTETATVQVSGKNTSVSGLTTASTYYVQTDGTLSTSPASPSVQAGKALSATSILIKG